MNTQGFPIPTWKIAQWNGAGCPAAAPCPESTGQRLPRATSHPSCLAGSGTEPEICASVSARETVFVLRLARLFTPAVLQQLEVISI